jgi:hypothetical protein
MSWNRLHTALVLVFIALVAGLCALATQLGLSKSNHLGLWFAVALGVLVLGLMIVVGHGVSHRIDGILIDARNRVTLGNFQLVAWTLVVITAWGGFFLTNLLAGTSAADALNVSVPQELWAALGVSGASYVGAKAIRVPQKNQNKLHTNPLPTAASWGELFTSDLQADQGHTDISKVQMFFFTIVLAIGYMGAVVNVLLNPTTPLHSLPPLNSAFVVVLAISHGGYLGRKATGNLT